MIGEWEKLAAWVAEDRSFLGWRETVRHEMDRWQEADRAPEHLPTPTAMAGAEQWLPARDAALNRAEQQKDQRAIRFQRRHHRRRHGAVREA
ncbi:hypothetical protein OCT49_00975 [Streptomyces sp. ML-6]|nr:hypothetical protein [Streptomyces sp. ML-6]MDK0517674.1 hypothetical protein [Streptomyces sp. ML-6]